jgi:uncharacterized protein (DUF1778 family)
MANKKLFPVYLATGEKEVLSQAAHREGRSLSSFLARSGLLRAETMHGLTVKDGKCKKTR